MDEAIRVPQGECPQCVSLSPSRSMRGSRRSRHRGSHPADLPSRAKGGDLGHEDDEGVEEDGGGEAEADHPHEVLSSMTGRGCSTPTSQPHWKTPAASVLVAVGPVSRTTLTSGVSPEAEFEADRGRGDGGQAHDAEQQGDGRMAQHEACPAWTRRRHGRPRQPCRPLAGSMDCHRRSGPCFTQVGRGPRSFWRSWSGICS